MLFVVDTVANPGFSGGPMVFKNENGKWAFGGVVRANVLGPAREEEPGQPAPPRVTPGMSLATGATSIQHLLDDHA